MSFEFLSKFSSKEGSRILVDSWVSSSEKGLGYSSRHDLVAILLKKGKFDILGRYLRKSIRKGLNNSSKAGMGCEFLGERNSEKEQWISLDVSPMSSQ